MNPQELHDFCTAITAALRQFAHVLAEVAEHAERPQMAARVRMAADDILDAYNQLEELGE